jgi:lipopolysaccharide biosynthesis regulator YciM
LPVAERVSRAQAIFNGLATDSGGPFKFQSAYYIGVGFVKIKQWDKAIEQFKAIIEMTPRDDKDRKVLELAQMSLGRVYFETAKYDEAIDAYAKVSQSSDNFPDSLYEVAWTYVRKGELDKAKNATEVLLLVAADSVLAPEATILQGTLLQKLSQYDDAISTYNGVINQYLPISDNLEELIKVANPEQYFDQMLTRNDKSLDVTKLLPPEALKWASTRDDVAQAVEITGSLDASRKGLIESRQIAQRILKSLDERGVESFPILQEGYTRADAVENSIAKTEENLTRIQGQLVEGVLSAEQRKTLDEATARERALKQRIDTLPTTGDQVKARKDRIQASIDAVERQAFQVSIEIQSQNAQLTAIRKYVDDTRSQRKGKGNPDDEKNFLERVTNEQRGLDGMQAELDEFRTLLLDERTNADKAISGEDSLRKEYAQMLEQDRGIFTQVRQSLGSDSQRVMQRTDVVRADALAIRERVVRSKGIIRERVERRAQKLREQVIAEQQLIESYAKDTDAITGETRNLVGRIAFDSFKRVHQSFYDLVLKANVGVVDVSFQRKQDKTSQIQKLAAQKDRELKQLDDEFKEVLKDVE